MYGNRKDILSELNIGEIYTSEELSDFISYNDAIIIFKDLDSFSTTPNNRKFKVEDCIKGATYKHKDPNGCINLSSNKGNYIVSLEK